MLIIGYSRASAPAAPAAPALNETVWDTGDVFDMRANGVAADGPAWTIAFAGRATRSDVGSQHFLGWNAGNGYVRRNGNATTFRVRFRRQDGTSQVSKDGFGNVANGDLFSVLVSCDQRNFSLTLNGTTHFNEAVGPTTLALEGPRWINSHDGSGAAQFNVRAVWVGAGYLSAPTHYASFFSDNGVPTAAMLSGGAVGGLSPQFAQSGRAAAWEAYAQGKSGGFDLEDA